MKMTAIPHILNLDKDFDCHSAHINDLPYEKFQFNGGEAHIKLSGRNIDIVTDVIISHRLNSGQNIMELLLATDALRQKYRNVRVSALIPYIPYGRQDRKMNVGEPFSLKVFAKLINSQNFERVLTLEPHSEVTGALINNLELLAPTYLDKASESVDEEYTLISPDAGALKRIYDNAKYLCYEKQIFCATKIRNTATGEIIRTTIDANKKDLKGKTVIISDDIGSRCGTFIALAKLLKEKGTKNIILALAHYEDVANEKLLKNAGITKIYTTNSISNKETEMVKKTRIKI